MKTLFTISYQCLYKVCKMFCNDTVLIKCLFYVNCKNIFFIILRKRLEKVLKTFPVSCDRSQHAKILKSISGLILRNVH